MRTIFTLLLSMATLFTAGAQIPNGNFEAWTNEFNYEKPIGWDTNQDTLYDRVLKSEDRIEGEYSLLLSSTSPSAWVDCSSTVGISTSLDQTIGENQFISFYLKSIPADDAGEAFFDFRAFYYKAGEPIGENAFIAEQTYDEFTLIELENMPVGTDSLQLYAFSGAINGADDGCYQYTDSWVDGLKINMPTSTDDISSNNIRIYPNPSYGIFNIAQDSDEFKNYRIVDILGREIQKGSLNQSKIRLSKKGPYIIQLFSDISSDRDVVRKIIVK